MIERSWVQLIVLAGALSFSVPARAAEPGEDPECLSTAARLREAEATTTTLNDLGDAYRRCGVGYGLLSLRAEFLLKMGRASEAAKDLSEELLSPLPSLAATALAAQLVSRLPAEDAKRLKSLGTSKQRPIHVRDLSDGDAWLKGIVCSGRDPATAARQRYERGKWLYYTWVACSIGTGQSVFWFLDGEKDRPVPRSNRPEPRVAESTDRLDVTHPEVQYVLGRVRGGYGIESEDNLRAAFLRPTPSTSLAWLLSFVTDDPTSVEVWKALVARDPDDLEAVTELARSTHVLQGPSAARAILERANPLTARLRNFNGAALTGLQPSTIVSLQCRYLVMERKLAEAERMCRQAIELGSQIIAHDNLARIALLRGDLDSANRASALAAKIGGAWQWSLRAVVMLLSNTDEKEFKLVLAHAMGDRGRPLAARLVYQRVKKSPAEWVEELESEEKQGWSTDLVKCGHFYVELGVPERSERCYQEARRIAPEAVSAAKALHLSESQPQQALTELEPVASGSKHPDVLAAMGVILHRLGRDREALDWLEHATARNPRLWQASAGISAACKRLQQPNCLMEAYERMHNRVLTP